MKPAAIERPGTAPNALGQLSTDAKHWSPISRSGDRNRIAKFKKPGGSPTGPATPFGFPTNAQAASRRVCMTAMGNKRVWCFDSRRRRPGSGARQAGCSTPLRFQSQRAWGKPGSLSVYLRRHELRRRGGKSAAESRIDLNKRSQGRSIEDGLG